MTRRGPRLLNHVSVKSVSHAPSSIDVHSTFMLRLFFSSSSSSPATSASTAPLYADVCAWICKGLMHAWVGTRRWCDREELAGNAALVFSLIMRIFYLGLRATTWRASASMARLTGVKNDGNNNGAHSRRHLPHQSVECCDLAECLIQGGHAALPAGVGKEVGGDE